MRFSTEMIFENSPEDAWLHFADTGSPLALTGCRELLPFFRTIMTEWPLEVRTIPDPAQPTPFLFVEKSNLKYVMHSQFMDASRAFSDPVDLVCAVIVEIAWETLRHNPEWLCLHCAAVEKHGRLILFPNTRRAGKTTLTTCLGLRGTNIFTDDFMALKVDETGQVMGMASGAAVRMRLPWPQNANDRFRNGLIASEIIRSRRYSYHAKLGNMPVRRGKSLPIGAIVILDRDEASRAEILPASRSEALGATITQNFSRAGNAARILQILNFLVSNLSTFRLRFSETEEAVDLLDQHFTSWRDPLPSECAPRADLSTYKAPELGLKPNKPSLPSGRKLVRNPGIVEYALEGDCFLADADGYAIHKLDQMSVAAWKLLEEPVTEEEIVTIFQKAFPDESEKAIAEDIAKLLTDLFLNRLICAT